MIRQAAILCAGLGSRLRPFTDHAPKPMLPLLGVPMVEWNIRRFREYGVKEFFINLHHLPDVLRDFLGDGRKLGVQIHYHFEPELLGTAGGIKSFEDQLDEEFFLIYGDIFSHVNHVPLRPPSCETVGFPRADRLAPSESSRRRNGSPAARRAGKRRRPGWADAASALVSATPSSDRS